MDFLLLPFLLLGSVLRVAFEYGQAIYRAMIVATVIGISLYMVFNPATLVSFLVSLLIVVVTYWLAGSLWYGRLRLNPEVELEVMSVVIAAAFFAGTCLLFSFISWLNSREGLGFMAFILFSGATIVWTVIALRFKVEHDRQRFNDPTLVPIMEIFWEAYYGIHPRIKAKRTPHPQADFIDIEDPIDPDPFQPEAEV